MNLHTLTSRQYIALGTAVAVILLLVWGIALPYISAGFLAAISIVVITAILSGLLEGLGQKAVLASGAILALLIAITTLLDRMPTWYEPAQAGSSSPATAAGSISDSPSVTTTPGGPTVVATSTCANKAIPHRFETVPGEPLTEGDCGVEVWNRGHCMWLGRTPEDKVRFCPENKESDLDHPYRINMAVRYAWSAEAEGFDSDYRLVPLQ